jgi:hypothetical protein
VTPQHRCLVVPWLRRPGARLLLPGWLATTVGPVIVSWRDLDPAELAHELEHVRQWRRHGLRFIPRYLGASRKAARAGGDPYLDNPFEIAARRAADLARAASFAPESGLVRTCPHQCQQPIHGPRIERVHAVTFMRSTHIRPGSDTAKPESSLGSTVGRSSPAWRADPGPRPPIEPSRSCLWYGSSPWASIEPATRIAP